MKQQMKKWIGKYWGIVCLAAAVLLLCVAGSFAAYTNFSSVRRVVSVKSREQTLFSSNMMYSEDKNTDSGSYKYKKITLNSNNQFVVEVYNYNIGDTTTYNNKDITYTLKATVYTTSSSAEGYSLTSGATTISFTGSDHIYTAEISGQSLSGSSANKNSYTIQVPEADKDSMKICMEAIPDESSYAATNQKKLAAFIITGEMEMEKDWTGKILDDQKDGRKPDDYDGFNYEITGNGQGIVTLIWDAQKLQISPWFSDEVKGKEGTVIADGSISFKVGGTDQPLAYLLQFYKAERWDSNTTWNELSTGKTGLIRVQFSE